MKHFNSLGDEEGIRTLDPLLSLLLYVTIAKQTNIGTISYLRAQLFPFLQSFHTTILTSIIAEAHGCTAYSKFVCCSLEYIIVILKFLQVAIGLKPFEVIGSYGTISHIQQFLHSALQQISTQTSPLYSLHVYEASIPE